ncbi:Uncharacterised protein [uncultured archaeon]|nr:Uncharacterised protein [uncultured archaeon]
MNGEQTKNDDTKLILDEWKTVIETQMHFNEMIMTMRTTGVSVVLAVFSAAAYSFQYNLMMNFIGLKTVHVAFFIVLFGIGMMIGIFILDYFYYYKMLLGAVERGYQIDKSYENKIIDGVKMFGMSTLISKKIGKRDMAKYFVWIFYWIIIILGVLFLYSIYYYIPITKGVGL